MCSLPDVKTLHNNCFSITLVRISKMDTTSRIALRQAQQQGSHKGGASSVSQLWNALAPTILVAIIIFVVFLVLQKRYARIYGPRSYLESLRQWQRSPPRSSGLLGWRKEYGRLRDDYVLAHSSIDNYLWLRFLKMLVIISFVGAVMTWVVLFPVNATGHAGNEGLDMLSFSNTRPGYRYFASCFVGWVFFGFVMLVITRESLFYIHLRQEYYRSPFERSRISSRSVLFINVPEEARDENYLRQQYADIANVWFVNVPEDLADKVEDRDKAANKLEAGEIKLLQNYTKRRQKLEKKNKITEQAKNIDSKKDRPTHRLPKLKFLPIGKKVDTITWSRSELARLIPEIDQEQSQQRDSNTTTAQRACIIEFESVEAAHEAFYQRPTNVKRLKNKVSMTPAELGVEPDNILWKNIIKAPAKVHIFNLVCTAFVAFLCIFWTIPVAVIGAISNINQLSNTIGFLSFLNSVPEVVMGFITGLLPAILLSVLMSLVPIVCMILAQRFCPTMAAAHLKVQGWYFPFQVIQVFLVTTFASGAASVVQSIIDDPSKAATLLAQNLPTASNFYISYFIVVGLMTAALQFLNAAPLVINLVLGRLLDKTPRKKFNRYLQLPGLGWGSLYPSFTNLGVIALAYSCIAPLVLGFATIGFGLMYLGFRYNCLFTLGTQVSTRGRCYARALQQLTTGVYIAEVCLIGLYALGINQSTASTGPLVCMIFFLVVTIVWHVLLKRYMSKLDREYYSKGIRPPVVSNSTQDPDIESSPSGPADANASDPPSHEMNRHAQNGNGMNGLPDAPAEKKVSQEPRANKGGFMERIKRFIKPRSKALDQVWKIAPHLNTPVRPYTEREHNDAYMHPATVSEPPMVWIAADKYGVSKKEVSDSKEAIGEGFDMTDEGAWFNDKGKVEWHQEDVKRAPIWEDEPIY